MNVRGNILFKEEQQFRVAWLWGLIILCMLSAMGVTIGLALSDKTKSSAGWLGVVIIAPVAILLVYFMYIAKLQTVVTSEGVFYKWSPFQRSYRFVAAADIGEVKKRNGPMLNYGCNWVPGYGRVNNVGPGKGFQFRLKDGRKIFLGTGKQAAFEIALNKIVNVQQRV